MSNNSGNAQSSHRAQAAIDSSLAEPLLREHEKETTDEKDETTTDATLMTGTSRSASTCTISTTNGTAQESESEQGEGNNDNNSLNDHQNDSTTGFSVRTELVEMAHLAIPLAVSFFCRMGMASTDSAFVGHLNDNFHTAETYLAAAVLSDMVIGVCITPPLAFNQVLNALVGQAMGSGQPRMAGVWLQQSVFWLVTTMLPCLVGLFHVQRILILLGFPEEIAHVAGTYAKYNLLWPIPNGVYQCMRFYFQAAGLPRPAMYNNILFLGINALLNWIFVFGGPFRYWHFVLPGIAQPWHGLGFIGAAISLSVSRTMQSVVYFWYMFVYQQHHLPTWPTTPPNATFLVHHTKERTWEFLKQSLPNIGTLLFQCCASQATTVLVGRLGELSIASSSALSTVTIPWSGTLSATCSMTSGVRVGYHLGRGNGEAARRAASIVLWFITVVVALTTVLFIPFQNSILKIATDDTNILHMAATLVPAMLVGTYLNLLVGTITSGVFSGMGRPLIATILSFGLELPLSIGGVAVYILVMHGNLLGVYWWQAISGGIEAVIVFGIMAMSNWDKCADEAQQRQEAREEPGDDNEQGREEENGGLVATESNSDTGEHGLSITNDLEAPLLPPSETGGEGDE